MYKTIYLLSSYLFSYLSIGPTLLLTEMGYQGETEY
jgi:hypothetical protein